MRCDDCKKKHIWAGQLFTSFFCIHCGRTFVHENTATPLLCRLCSDNNHICERCGHSIIRTEDMSELEGADMSLVEVKDGTPHCKIHGAMNMVNPSGVWRCITSYRWEKCFSPKGVETTSKLVENNCRAGCAIKGGD